MKLDTSKKLADIMKDVMGSDGTTTLMLEKRAESLWRSVMGATVNRATCSVRVKDGVMYVGMTSSVVRSEMINMKGRIIAALNKTLMCEVIRDIRFM